MLVIYFDEVKYNGTSQMYEWLSGIAVHDEHIPHIESQVTDIAEKCFSSRILSPSTELHAAEIFHRKRNFKSWADIGKRIQVLKDLATILAQRELIKRISVRIEVDRLSPGDNAKERAFVFFVERANGLVMRAQTRGLLIGDFEKERIARESASDLSGFRENGTPYPYGQEINGLIDTVHFSHSYSSRMLQLADAYAWFMQFAHSKGNAESPRSELASFLTEEADIVFPDTYKFWPTQNSWNQTGTV